MEPERLMALYRKPADGQLVIKSLAKPAGEQVNVIASVSLLGQPGQLQWKQTAEALLVTLPAEKPCEHAFALKITGADLKPIAVPEIVETMSPDAQGNVTLVPDTAELHGDQIKQEQQGGTPNIGFWDRSDEWVSWKVQFTQAGSYQVSVRCSTVNPESEFVLEVAGQQLAGKVSKTGTWADFRSLDLGRLEIKQPGEQIVKVRPRDAKTWKAINLASVTLKPAK